MHQDRLIREPRRKGIDSYEAADQHLEKEYLARAQPTLCLAGDYHGTPTACELRQIFRLETEHDQQRLGDPA